MADEKKNGLPEPSDKTLTTNYVSLKPGNYKPRTDLTKYKGKNLTNTEALDYLPDHPFGVGDASSVVYIYPQGTVEIIGRVYVWNKLVKPGIYSRYEKIRYLNEEEIQPRLDKNIYRHHAAYNRTIRVDNPYVSRRTSEKEWLLEYHFVDWNTQFTTIEGDKVYPIPILNGLLTVYPDGTFKAENVVVESKTTKLVDPYGYLGDQTHFSNIKTFYNNVTKDDINPLNVYKVISENEDGSITYGAIDENKHLIQSNWLPMPKGIIPINDGKVTIGYDGTIKIEGTVITAKGYRITANIFKIYELFNDYDNLIENDDYVDKSAVYNPKCYIDTDEGFKFVTLHIADINNPKDIYQYHPVNESYYVMNTEVGIVATYQCMPGWDVFVKDSPDKYNLGAAGLWYQPISATTGEDIKFDKTHYPWVAKGRIMIGNKIRLPHVRFSPEYTIDCYSTFDHTSFWYPKDLTNAAVSAVDEDHIYLTKPHQEDDLLVPVKIGKVTSKFFPYNGGKVVFTKEGEKIFVNVTGNVIWNRNDQYYTLDEGKVELNVDWPDIKEDENGHYVELFTVNGYFKDEPIFINKDGKQAEIVGNDLITIDGVKRQEIGMFRLIKRNVTAYLTDYEKYFIDNHVPNYRTFNYNVKTGKIDEVQYYASQVTSEDTGLLLDYYQFRFNEVLPLAVSCNAVYLDDKYGSIKDTKRLYWYDRDKQSLVLYRDMYFSLYNRELNRTRLLEVKKDQSNLTYGDISTFKGHMNQVGMQPKLGYSLKEGNNANVRENVERSESMFGNKPHITVPKSHIVSDGHLQVSVSGVTIPTNLFWRFGNDTKTISEGTSVKYDESFELDVIPATILKFNYIELWLDDPFNEDSELHRVMLRKDRKLTPLEILRPEEIDDFTSDITIAGESKAHIVLVDPINPDIIIAESDADDNGIAVFKDLTLLAKHQYKFIQTDGWGLTSDLMFDVKKHIWKNNDFITPEQLFGKDIHNYYYPYNVRHKDNLNDVLNLIDSRLVISANTQKYTISGIMMDEDGNIFPEGTYNIGTHPESYKAIYINGNLIRSKVVQKTKRNVKGYVVGEMFDGSLNKPLKVSKASFTKDELNTEKYTIPLKWLSEGKRYLDNLEFWNAEYLHFTKLDANDLLTNLKDKLHFGNIGRYQNRIVIEDIAVFKLGLNDNLFDILGYEESEGMYNRYNKEGYSLEQLLKVLKVKEEYWYEHVNDLEDKPFIQNHLSIDHSSYTIPKDRPIRSFAVSTLDMGYTHNNLTLITPNSYTIDYIFNIYTLKNHNTIVKNKDYHNEQNIVHYGIEYAYQLRRNYTSSNPMDVDVFDHWSSKGFNPNMFNFDDRTLGWVEYDRLGEKVTIHGRVKIAGRYTKNKIQEVSNKSQIEFINYCPDGFISHDGNGNVVLNDDDTLSVVGLVYGRNCINGEIVDRPWFYNNSVMEPITLTEFKTVYDDPVLQKNFNKQTLIFKFINVPEDINPKLIKLNILTNYGVRLKLSIDDSYVIVHDTINRTLTITKDHNLTKGFIVASHDVPYLATSESIPTSLMYALDNNKYYPVLNIPFSYDYRFKIVATYNDTVVKDSLYGLTYLLKEPEPEIYDLEYLPDLSPEDRGFINDKRSYILHVKNVSQEFYNIFNAKGLITISSRFASEFNNKLLIPRKRIDKLIYNPTTRKMDIHFYNVNADVLNNLFSAVYLPRGDIPLKYREVEGSNQGNVVNNLEGKNSYTLTIEMYGDRSEHNPNSTSKYTYTNTYYLNGGSGNYMPYSQIKYISSETVGNDVYVKTIIYSEYPDKDTYISDRVTIGTDLKSYGNIYRNSFTINGGDANVSYGNTQYDADDTGYYYREVIFRCIDAKGRLGFTEQEPAVSDYDTDVAVTYINILDRYVNVNYRNNWYQIYNLTFTHQTTRQKYNLVVTQLTNPNESDILKKYRPVDELGYSEDVLDYLRNPIHANMINVALYDNLNKLDTRDIKLVYNVYLDDNTTPHISMGVNEYISKKLGNYSYNRGINAVLNNFTYIADNNDVTDIKISKTQKLSDIAKKVRLEYVAYDNFRKMALASKEFACLVKQSAYKGIVMEEKEGWLLSKNKYFRMRNNISQSVYDNIYIDTEAYIYGAPVRDRSYTRIKIKKYFEDGSIENAYTTNASHTRLNIENSDRYNTEDVNKVIKAQVTFNPGDKDILNAIASSDNAIFKSLNEVKEIYISNSNLTKVEYYIIMLSGNEEIDELKLATLICGH